MNSGLQIQNYKNFISGQKISDTDPEAESPAGQIIRAYSAAMENDCIFYDGKPQSGASGSARPAFVYTVKALEDMRQMLISDADAVVGQNHFNRAVRESFYADVDACASAVGQGVGQQIVEYG